MKTKQLVLLAALVGSLLLLGAGLTLAQGAPGIAWSVFDRGGGQLVNGVAVIHLDPIWLETVTIDAAHPMRVQVTLTGDCNGVYVVEKTATGPSTGSGQASFTVRELRGGTSNATFDWEVAAKRKGYEEVRLEPTEIR